MRCMEQVYGLPENVASCVICGWADDPAYSAPSYLARLPKAFRNSIERTITARSQLVTPGEQLRPKL